ncbi:MAG TPA: ribosome maturation factor RimM [Burkholderiales bacterium]|nr:ribosome maturation factor RimM [Burkholderiales bacterium]
MRKKPPEKMLVIGRIAAPYGVKGWIKIHPYTETIERLTRYSAWWLGKEGEWREAAVVQTRPQGKTLVAKLQGCDDRAAAQLLKNQHIAVQRSQLPAAKEGEYYWADLIGLEVVNLGGESLGVVSALFATGANDVLRVQGDRERLIPFIPQVVREVNLDAALIRVDWELDY